ncbi:Ribokinase-like protein [Amylocystis lapponica]|nr:Ribokinase-like protein [Amylocystis lapponica]
MYPVKQDGIHFASLGMFIIDEFAYCDEDGNPTGRTLPPQIGGGGTYASIGARIWLPAATVGMIIDRGHDFPDETQKKLDSYGKDMWLFRDHSDRGTTRALNSYKGDTRGFAYLTPRIRITPRDLANTKLARPFTLHFICSPSRAASILSEVQEETLWNPITIYEPIPDRCIPEELPAMTKILPFVTILSPNAEEALSLLSMPHSPTKALIEQAAHRFLDFGVGVEGHGCVIIRSGALGAFVTTRERGDQWVDAFWENDKGQNAHRIVDVTGAGNSFLGGLAAGLLSAGGDVYEGTLYATVSASFIVEQEGLPILTYKTINSGEVIEEWNGDSPERRLKELHRRMQKVTSTQ